MRKSEIGLKVGRPTIWLEKGNTYMSSLVVVTREGHEKTLETETDITVLQVLREAGIDEIEALCGGSCACATCHVYVGEAWQESVGSLGADEDALLDGCDHRKENSRLACQVKFTDKLDGMRITIAPEE